MGAETASCKVLPLKNNVQFFDRTVYFLTYCALPPLSNTCHLPGTYGLVPTTVQLNRRHCLSKIRRQEALWKMCTFDKTLSAQMSTYDENNNYVRENSLKVTLNVMEDRGGPAPSEIFQLVHELHGNQ
jgi:hypothetical protein